MPLRQIDHVDIIAHAGAVGRGVIVAEHVQAVQLADGDLRDIGHEVVGDAVRVLADQTALMRADGVEIAQQHDAPLVVGGVNVLEDIFNVKLGRAVGVGGAARRHILTQRRGVVGAVNGGGGREHDFFHARVAHGFAERHRAAHVVLIIFQRLAAAFAHGLEPGEMDDRVDFILGKNSVQPRAVADVTFAELEVAAGNFPDAIERFRLAVIEIIEYNDLITLLDEFDAGVRADVTGAARNKNRHNSFLISSKFSEKII